MLIFDLTQTEEMTRYQMAEVSGGKRRFYLNSGASLWKRSRAITSPHQESPEEEEEPTQSYFGGISSLSLW